MRPPWSQKEGVSGTKHFYWVISCPISQLFTTFLCVYQIPMTPTKASNDSQKWQKSLGYDSLFLNCENVIDRKF